MQNNSGTLSMEKTTFVAYPHELSWNICQTNFSPHEGRIFAFVVRKTFGYHKQRDRISLSQFEAGTGLERRRAHEAIMRLIGRRILCSLTVKEKSAKIYWINTNFSEWKRTKCGNLSPRCRTDSSVALTKDSLSHVLRTDLSPASVTNLSHLRVPTKEKEEKKKILKESAASPALDQAGSAVTEVVGVDRDRRLQERKALLLKQLQSLRDAETMDTTKADR